MGIKLTFLLLVFAVLGFLILYIVAPRFVIKTARSTNALPSNFPLSFENIKIAGVDEDMIDASWVNHHQDTQTTIIFLHGVNSNKQVYQDQAQWLAELNVSSMLIDLRAHGMSEGEYCTYGFFERHDIAHVVDYILARSPDQRIGIWGHSLGGAIALQSMALDDRISFGVIQSTFRDYSEVVMDYGKRLSKGLAPDIIIKYVMNRASDIAQFEIDAIKPIDAAKQISKPIFFAHGTDDPNISFEYGKSNYDQCISNEKVFYPVKGGDHDNIYEIGGQEYASAIRDFLLKHI